ncbi:uncharacterized protein B0I36DRAFT_367836 [Microdochium trichocladiopsis]|uniref:Uncharacterized protein n=1 Tax=Microdochium trichocladiopsis TaxID=1682393 RepID=A0A9P8XWE5_9PEZI|nr:uncharacterized protein B0I36DRAFT_367836 [Microdochium trichocladiopsis]KAH7021423.1 hypothetical protein B0I36DRAFT_367836 [Microdochium trichocladiopsis]
MHLLLLVATLLMAVAFASDANNAQVKERQTTSAPTPARTSLPASSTTKGTTQPFINVPYVSSLLNNYLDIITSLGPMLPSPTTTVGLSIPEVLKAQIYTAIPPSVLVQLMNTSYRASVSADFASGSTPAWYQELSPELRTFLKNVAGTVHTGDKAWTKATQETAAAVQSVTSSALAPAPIPEAARRAAVAGAAGLVGAVGYALL